MTAQIDAPERIWAHSENELPKMRVPPELWHLPKHAVPYVRADLHDAAQAEIAKLRAALDGADKKADEWLTLAFERRDHAQNWLDSDLCAHTPEAQFAAHYQIVDSMNDRIRLIYALFPNVAGTRAATEAQP